MRWTAVVNPVAGRGRTRRLLPDLTEALTARGVGLHVATDADDGRRAARAAFERGEGVVACGGDGTVYELAAVAADADGVLAVLPTGSGNDFARHFGIGAKPPLDALGLLEHGRVVRCDLGRAVTADGAACRFTTVANTGFDSEANRWANGVQWATGTTLYVAAVVRTLAVYRPRPVRVTIDGVVWEGPAWLVAVGNTRYYAGGMMITPGARTDDGLLDVCIIGPIPTARFLVRFPQVFRGTHVSIPGVETFRGRVVEVETLGPDRPLELYASGEHVGPLPARVECDPGALRLVVPPEPPGLVENLR